MIDLGLSPEDRRAYEAGLLESRRVRIEVRLLDRNERLIGDLAAPGLPDYLSGQVTFDADADVTRHLTLDILDPQRRLRFEPDSPAEGGLYPNHLVQVVRYDDIPAAGGWVPAPLFTGPIANFERRGAEVTIEGLGKERLALAPAYVWRPMNLGKGVGKRSAIRRILYHVGERRFDFPAGGAGLPRRRSVGRHQEAWKVAKRYARAIDRQIYYDGRGYVALRRPPDDPTWVFREQSTPRDSANMLEAARIAYDLDHVRNTIEVLGGQPRGRKRRIRAVRIADRRHPFSPWNLGRNGEPLYLVERLEEPDIKRQKGANQRAERELRRGLRLGYRVEFEAPAVPTLEEDDVCLLVRADGERIEFHVRQAVIPLMAGAPMLIGTTKRTRLRKRPKGNRR